MTIDEEIKKQRSIAYIYSVGDDFEEYIQEHNQIAEWLEELKELRAMRDTLESNAECLVKQGRRDAIDAALSYCNLKNDDKEECWNCCLSVWKDGILAGCYLEKLAEQKS